MKLPHRIKSFYSKIKKIGFNKKKIKYDFQYFFLVDTYKKLNKINDSAKSIRNHLLLNFREKIIYSFTNFQNFLENLARGKRGPPPPPSVRPRRPGRPVPGPRPSRGPSSASCSTLRPTSPSRARRPPRAVCGLDDFLFLRVPHEGKPLAMSTI